MAWILLGMGAGHGPDSEVKCLMSYMASKDVSRLATDGQGWEAACRQQDEQRLK